MRPEEISAAVLSRLAANAAAKMNAPVEGAVITVPATFNNQQRIATENAARIAGLKVCDYRLAAVVYHLYLPVCQQSWTSCVTLCIQTNWEHDQSSRTLAKQLA